MGHDGAAPLEWRLRFRSGAAGVALPVCCPDRLALIYPQLDTDPLLARKRLEGNRAGTAPALGGCR